MIRPLSTAATLDVGTQYRSAIYYNSDKQKRIAEASIAKLAAAKRYPDPIVTEVTGIEAFYPAEGYHQEYYELNKRGRLLPRHPPETKEARFRGLEAKVYRTTGPAPLASITPISKWRGGSARSSDSDFETNCHAFWKSSG